MTPLAEPLDPAEVAERVRRATARYVAFAGVAEERFPTRRQRLEVGLYRMYEHPSMTDEATQIAIERSTDA